MKILVGKCFGLGNSVLSIPMIKAIRSLPDVEKLDVLVGATPDDGGAWEVFCYLQKDGVIDDMFRETSRHVKDTHYDHAIMSIPFDGRWQNGWHYKADNVIDGRTRPDPSTVGLMSWKKHEIEYQMDNARELGYKGPVPDTSFYPKKGSSYPRDIYLGVGYKKDTNNFWSQKHMGNEMFSTFVETILDKYDNAVIKSTGDMLDWNLTLQPIANKVKNNRFLPSITNLHEAFETMSTCGLYVGNDTGMMHVAASMGIPCVVYFGMGSDSIVKNAPWGSEKYITTSCNDFDIINFVCDNAIRIIENHG